MQQCKKKEICLEKLTGYFGGVFLRMESLSVWASGSVLSEGSFSSAVIKQLVLYAED